MPRLRRSDGGFHRLQVAHFAHEDHIRVLPQRPPQTFGKSGDIRADLALVHHPARVLVEVCNLNNPEDRRLLQTRQYREKVAEALVAALVGFYGGKE